MVYLEGSWFKMFNLPPSKCIFVYELQYSEMKKTLKKMYSDSKSTPLKLNSIYASAAIS